jgi:hypothetical protein
MLNVEWQKMKVTIEVDRLKVEGERFPREKPEVLIRALRDVSNTSPFSLQPKYLGSYAEIAPESEGLGVWLSFDVGRSMFTVRRSPVKAICNGPTDYALVSFETRNCYERFNRHDRP